MLRRKLLQQLLLKLKVHQQSLLVNKQQFKLKVNTLTITTMVKLLTNLLTELRAMSTSDHTKLIIMIMLNQQLAKVRRQRKERNLKKERKVVRYHRSLLELELPRNQLKNKLRLKLKQLQRRLLLRLPSQKLKKKRSQKLRKKSNLKLSQRLSQKKRLKLLKILRKRPNQKLRNKLNQKARQNKRLLQLKSKSMTRLFKCRNQVLKNPTRSTIKSITTKRRAMLRLTTRLKSDCSLLQII